MNTIAKCIGVSKSSVHNSYARLERRGLIHITRTNKENGKPNTVSLLHPKLIYGEKAYFDWDAIWTDVKERKPKSKAKAVFGETTGGISPTEPPVQPVRHHRSADTIPQREKEQRKIRERYETARSSASSIASLGVQQLAPSGRETQQKKEEDLRLEKKNWGNAPRALHRHFQIQTEQKFGFSFVPDLKSKHIKMWELVLQRLGSIEAAMGLIRFTCEQWEDLRDHFPSLHDQPSVELFASGWLDAIHGKYRALQNGFQIKDRLLTKAEAENAKRSQELLDKYTIR